jgi:hypothetical protein
MAFIYKITNKITKKCYIGETKQKIRESVLTYYKENQEEIRQINIEKHRNIMANATGKK